MGRWRDEGRWLIWELGRSRGSSAGRERLERLADAIVRAYGGYPPIPAQEAVGYLRRMAGVWEGHFGGEYSMARRCMVGHQLQDLERAGVPWPEECA